MAAILNQAPPWQAERSRYVVLWHGCSAFDKDSIEAHGIDLAHSRVDLDFGRGFYTTTLLRQGQSWAWNGFRKARRNKGNQPVVLRFRVPRAPLGKLVSLNFVLSDYHNEDFWSLLQHCRQSVPARGRHAGNLCDHKGPHHGWYDLVSGPVAAFWEQRVAMVGADQVSFHTPKALKLLNDLIRGGDPDDYRWEPVL